MFYDILFYFLRELELPKIQYDKLVILSEQIISNWNDIRMKVIYLVSKNSKIKKELIDDIYSNIENEKIFVKEIIGAIDILNIDKKNIKNKADRKQIKIHNPAEAKITKSSKTLIFEHTDRRSFDTWINQDEAPQILVDVLNNNIIKVSCKIISQKSFDPSFASGIIIKCRNGEKYIFSFVANSSIQVHCPEKNTEYELVHIMYSNLVVFLKIKIELGNVFFYYKQMEDDNWNLIYQNKIFDINYVGFISKTWDRINYTTIFSEYNIVLDGESVVIE